MVAHALSVVEILSSTPRLVRPEAGDCDGTVSKPTEKTIEAGRPRKKATHTPPRCCASNICCWFVFINVLQSGLPSKVGQHG